MMSRPSIVLGLTIASALTSACQLLTPKQSLEPQREQVRALRVDLEQSWRSVKVELDDADHSIDQFCSFQVNPAKFDPKALSEALRGGWHAEVAEGTASKLTAETALASFKVAADNADSDTRAQVEAAYNEGQRIHQKLTTDLPEMIKGLASKAGDVTVQLAEIKASAAALSPVADNNAMMSGDEKRKFQADQAALEADIAELGSFADTVTRDGATYSQRLATATTRFQAKLESLTQ